MLSRSLHTAPSTGKALKTILLASNNVSKICIRLQSTQTEEAIKDASTTSKITPTKTESKNLEKRNNTNSTPRSKNNNGNERRGNPFISALFKSLSQDYTEFSPFFEQVQHAFQKASAEDKTHAYNSMIGIGNTLLSKILTIKEQTKNDVPNSILYKEIITLLVDNKLIHSSHLTRYIRELISEKKYLNALTVWIENVNFFRTNKKAFVSRKYDNEQQNENNFNLLGLSLYLLSLIENNEKSVDPEFIKLIFDKKHSCSLSHFERSTRFLPLAKEDAETIIKLYSDFKNLTFDINSQDNLNSIKSASFDGRIVHLEKMIESTLNLYKGKESTIHPITLAKYMEYLNNVKLYSRSIEIWKFASANKIEITTDIWNQLLLSFTNLKTDNALNKVNSVWELMKRSCTLNSKSYSIYIQFLLKNNEIEKVETLINSLKKDKNKLFDSELKCSMIEFLIASNKINEAISLFKIYQNDESFIPTITVYNKLLSKLIYVKKFDDAKILLDELINQKYKKLSPDTATWTTIIDFFLKSSVGSNLTKDEILNQIFAMIDSMKSQKVHFNLVAFITVASNLLRNPQTSDIGFSILQHMESSNIKLNAVAYSGIVTTFTKAGDMDNALYYYNKAISNGIPVTAFFYNSILKGYSNSPNVYATREFMNNIKKLIKENPNNLRLLPNKYTFYYLLLQGVSLKDHDFVNEVLKDLSEADTELGDALPGILKSLKANGYEIPDSLTSKIGA